MGKIDFFAQKVDFDESGRFFVIQGESVYNIYTARAVVSKYFGESSATVWRYSKTNESKGLEIKTGHFASSDVKLAVNHREIVQ